MTMASDRHLHELYLNMTKIAPNTHTRSLHTYVKSHSRSKFIVWRQTYTHRRPTAQPGPQSGQ